jgi:hypothetical protein
VAVAVTLEEWATRWRLPPQALAELSTIGAGEDESPEPVKEGSEALTQSLVRLEAAEAGWHLWRNNVGALKDERGRVVRYGLANDSSKLNAVLKSADLVGWRPRLIKVDDVGKILAQFASRECKAPGWTYTGTEREVAQLRWHSLVMANGGDSAIVHAKGSIGAK